MTHARSTEGFRCPRFSHEVLLDERIVDDLESRHDTAPSSSRSRRSCARHRRTVRARAAGRSCCQRQRPSPASARRTADATRCSSVPLSNGWPPVIWRRRFDSPASGYRPIRARQDLWGLLKPGRRFRSLGSRDGLPTSALAADADRRSHDRVVRQRTAAEPCSPDQDSPARCSVPRSPAARWCSSCARPAAFARVGDRCACAWRAWCADCRDRSGGARRRRRDSHRRRSSASSLPTARHWRRCRRPEISCVTVLSGLDPPEHLRSPRRPRRAGRSLRRRYATIERQERWRRSIWRCHRCLRSGGVSEPECAWPADIHIGPELDYLERAFDCVKHRRGLHASVARHYDSVDRRHGTGAGGCPRCIDLHTLRAIAPPRRVSGTWQRTCPAPTPWEPSTPTRLADSGSGRRC